MNPIALNAVGTSTFAPSIDEAAPERRFAGPRLRDGASPDPVAERATRRKIARNSRELVAGALLMPILSEARAARQKGGAFGVSKVEERFGPVFDRELANAMVERGGFAVVDQVERSMLQRAGLRPLPAPSTSRNAARGPGVFA